MNKYRIELDEKCTIYRRYNVEVEANSLEEAKKKVIKSEGNDLPVEYLLDTAEPLTKKENAAIEAVEYLIPEDEWEISYGFDEKNIEVREIMDDNCYKI